jgi:dipeptide transport system ATP-binding protein
MTVLLSASGLAKTYTIRKGAFGAMANVHALSGVSFSLEPGRTLAIVGESGCGKSTLARLVTMMEQPSSGHLSITGIELSKATSAEKRQLRPDVQMVFQNPYGSLNPRQTVLETLIEPLVVNHVGSAAKQRDTAMAMLERVGLRPEQAGRYPHMFSGGQRQRIAIARALVLSPKILVLDEPVAALDISIRAQILNLLAELQKEFQLAYLFISHDLSVVRHIADDLMVIYLGRAVETGPAETLFASPQHPYTQALLSATPSVDPARRQKRIVLKGELPSPINPPKGCAFHPRCPAATARCVSDLPDLAPAGAGHVACWHPGSLMPQHNAFSPAPLRV